MTRMRLLLVTLALGACGDNLAAPRDAGSDATDGATDAQPEGLAACLDQPTALLRPPQGQLPCELIPPGLTTGGAR